MQKLIYLFFVLGIIPSLAFAQADSAKTTFHFQQTVVSQYHVPFHSPYYGRNSLENRDGWHTSLTTTIFTGLKLWKGAEFYFNPEMAGGSGLSGAYGIAGFPNGETFRVGNPSPTLYIARGFLRQHIALSKDFEEYKEGNNQIGSRLPADRITITAGKLCMGDMFDNNSFSHDPRSQFLNWSLMEAGAWDFPANTRGYTYSIVVEDIHPKWAIRVASSMVPVTANGPYLDLNIGKAHSETIEFEKHYTLGKKNGSIRILGYTTLAFMGSYKMVLSNVALYDTSVINTRSYGRRKSGFIINLEQNLTSNSGVFIRGSWNDGQNETWAYTEIDASLSAGYFMNGGLWHRANDKFGIACVVNGLSDAHRDYLAAGGYGFIIGDGKLNYSNEIIVEAMYNYKFNNYFFISPDYQFVLNPAYNKDRGPVHIIGFRGHIEF